MARRRQIVFDRRWVSVSQVIGITCAHLGSRHSPDAKRNEQDETLLFLYPFVAETDGTLQVTSCKRISNIGFPLPTHQRIMTLFGKRTILERPHGSLRVMQ